MFFTRPVPVRETTQLLFYSLMAFQRKESHPLKLNCKNIKGKLSFVPSSHYINRKSRLVKQYSSIPLLDPRILVSHTLVLGPVWIHWSYFMWLRWKQHLTKDLLPTLQQSKLQLQLRGGKMHVAWSTWPNIKIIWRHLHDKPLP